MRAKLKVEMGDREARSMLQHVAAGGQQRDRTGFVQRTARSKMPRAGGHGAISGKPISAKRMPMY